MAEVKPDEKKRKNPLLTEKVVEEPSLDDVLSGRKRKSSFDGRSRNNGRDKSSRSASGMRSSSPADGSLTGRSEGSGYIQENASIASEDPHRYYHEDHESIASMRADEASLMEDGSADRPGSSNSINIDKNFDEDADGFAEETLTAPTKEASQPSNFRPSDKDIKEEVDNDDAEGDRDEEGDGANDESGKGRIPKPRRKRTSSILKSLESIHSEDATPLIFNDDDANLPRYQSNRAAAMLAKTKLSSKGGRSSSMDDPAVAETGESAATEKTEKTPRNANISRRRKSGALASAPKLSWVQCNKCTKWRTVAAHVNDSELPDEWYCHMNSWDANFSTCDAPEETEQTTTVSTGRGRSAGQAVVEDGDGQDSKNQQRVWVKAGNGGRGRWKRPGDGGEGRDSLGGEGNDGYAPEDGGDGADPAPVSEEQVLGVQSRRRSSQGLGRQADAGAAAGTSPRSTATQRQASTGSLGALGAPAAGTGETGAVNWVQCNKCRKWRKVPERIDVDALPEIWFCTLNTWNPMVARCGARQEPDDPVVPVAVDGAAAAAAGGAKGVGRARRQQSNTIGNSASYNALPSLASPIAPPGTIKKVQWVQCERRNCKKWRKVPGAIDMEQFPEKWYCEMNTWDADSASCDAPEASDSENEQPGGAASRQQLILANSKGANALSYRRIIFGTDGRIRVCFSDKNKNGYGIFSYSEAHKPSNDADDYTAPTRRVGYWWSSAYDESAGAAAAQASLAAGGKTSSKKLAAAAAAAAILAESGENQVTIGAGKAEVPAPTYLLDTARRLAGLVPRPATFSWPKKISKAWMLLSKMPLFRRQNLECTAVMSCFMSTPSSQLSFSKLLSLLSTCRFADPEVDACREYLGAEGLKGVVKRLEDRGLVEVSFTSTGQLNVDVLPPVAQIAQNCAVRGAVSASVATGVSPAWTKQGLPLKLRKFHAEGKYKQHTVMDAKPAAASRVAPAPVVVKAEKEQQKVVESLAAVSVSAKDPSKPLHLQHKKRWAAAQAAGEV
eukprot:CAMPEP_0184991476 /NCGR_PEP_ID=MMETSP1098-20130426/36732_1 /TAXON_ID=89044 /ORGANISM="Spumella elongata, Strain CCAP 955/1" /LENGTH=1011 /DNA_ID=CAMNT_0027516907 /DNA_START=57 /DNA_END=3092 /DNA_ORIENTATION=+